MKPEDYCMRCMEPITGGACKRCGWTVDTPSDSPISLPPGTILNGHYMIGAVLGAGGFGVTYIAIDPTLNWKLAIKEYYPAGFGIRAPGVHTIAPISTQFRDAFENGLNRFVQEGQALARFQHHPGVVSVITLFRENGTAYLVMRYEDGVSLKDYLEQRGGRLAFPIVRDIMMRVMDTLRALHAGGLLHRDISPENIYINDAGQVKLLDFGAAKHDMASRDRSLQVTIKRGYSPVEQYTDAPGRQGPWTDVYALAATAYRALSGETPPESIDRRAAGRDPLVAPSRCGIEMPRAAEKALLRALAISPEARFRTVEEFQESFRGEPEVKPDRRKLVALLAASACILAILAIWLGTPDVSFMADRSAIDRGQSAMLEWKVGRGSVTISPDIGPRQEQNGRIAVSPTETTRYALSANGFLRRSIRFVTVNVTPGAEASVAPRRDESRPLQPAASAPTIAFFRATPGAIQPGQPATLEWRVSGNARVAMQWPDPKQKQAPQSVELALAGSRVVNPQRTTTYTLIATGADGRPVTVTASVNVRPVDSASRHDEVDTGSSGSGRPKDDGGTGGRRVGDPGPGGGGSTTAVAGAGTPAAGAQTTGTAQILTVDEQGQPLLAVVQLFRGDRKLSEDFSGTKGAGFTGSPGDYRVRVTAEGYEPASASFSVEPDGWKRVTVTLHKAKP